MSMIDYKSKYMDLKAKFMSTVDLSYRLGFEAGLKESQIDQANQQAQEAQMQQQQMAQAGQPGAPQPGTPEESPSVEDTTPVQEEQKSMNPNEDELGQHIEKLESMVAKSEISPTEMQDLKKTLNDIKSLQIQMNLTKSMDSIKHNHSHKHAPLKLTPKLQANLSVPAKKALTLQEEIVNNILEKWENDSSKTSSDISSILGIEGLVKKD